MDSFKKLLTPKLIFIILGVALAAELVWAVVTFVKPAPPLPPVAKIQPVSGAKMVLVSPKKSYTVGEIVPVALRVATGGRLVDGVDALIKFDPKVLEATSGAIKKGIIFTEYPLLSVDPKAGLVKISAISSAKSFSGIGVLANISFKAKSSGTAKLMIDFEKDQTTDSNVVEAQSTKDVLDEVFGLDLSIR